MLPDDLPELLKFTGNPLIDLDLYDDDEEAEEAEEAAHAPQFDLNNAEHRAALKQRVDSMFL